VPAAGRSLWAGLHLLDHQVVDREGASIAKVDDLDFALSAEPDGLPVLTDILCGQAALARRFDRRLGRAIEHLRRVIDPTAEPGPCRIAFGTVTRIGPEITVALDRDEVEVTVVERWLAAKVLAAIPGSGRSREGRRP
jgi:hypothetical protein